jgi:tetratricopeptide (TPR) repeat protein
VDDDFAAIPRDNLWLGALTFLAHAAWVSSNFTSARVLERALEPYVALNATLGSALALGSVARPLALAQALQGRFDDAAANLERAVVANAGMDSALWRATAQRDLAQVLLLRGRPEDALRAEQDAAEADEIAMQLGARRISLDVR